LYVLVVVHPFCLVCLVLPRRPPRSTLFPYTRSSDLVGLHGLQLVQPVHAGAHGLEVGHHAAQPPGVHIELAAAGSLLADGLLSLDRKSTRLNSSHVSISYAVFCLKNKTPPFVTQRVR